MFACECADLTCIEQVEMSLDEYEAVRREPDEFFVRPGHVYPDVERVVRDTERYVVVAKIAEAAEAAERHSPAATS